MPDNRTQTRISGYVIMQSVFCALCSALFLLSAFYSLLSTPAFADELVLQELIDETLKRNHEILHSQTRELSAGFRIPQAGSLPDPMLMVGYMNDGVRDLYTFDKEMAKDSQWMLSVAQMFPFPGKLPLKSEMALRDKESIQAMTDVIRLKAVARVKELYYDLLFSYKNMDFLKERSDLFKRVEDAALARYSTGMAPQQEVLMAQAEKFMIMEKEEMLKQKIQSLEAMLNTIAGRDPTSPLGRPQELPPSEYVLTMDELIRAAVSNSPEIKAQEKMIAAADAKVRMTEKEYYPDITMSASYFAKNKYYQDMWSLTTSINVPIYYKSKQRQAALEAQSMLSEADHQLESMQLMIASAVKDNHSMLTSAQNLMGLYREALIPKTYQDFETALSGYTAGKIEAMTVINRLKALIDYEIAYWQQFTEREKAIARLEALTAVSSQPSAVSGQGEK